MLVIRDAQLQQFIAPSEDDLIKAVCDAVAKANPARVESLRPGRIIAMAKIGIERARSVGATRPEQLRDGGSARRGGACRRLDIRAVPTRPDHRPAPAPSIRRLSSRSVAWR